MNWKLKSLIQRACSAMPGGQFLYFQLQKRAGGLRNPDYHAKLACHRNLVSLLLRHKVELDGATVLEVGTGWIPLIPIGFWLCGAARVQTYDVNRHIRPALIGNALRWMAQHSDEIAALYKDAAPPEMLRSRLETLQKLQDRPLEFMSLACIDYFAPADASATGLPEETIDIHFSSNVFEHVPPEALRQILSEARRVLRRNGVALHHVDPTDHFSHCDPDITAINFLRFQPAEWAQYSGSHFSYHNRLRDLDYRCLFGEAGFILRECGFLPDERALAALRAGFPLAEEYRQQDPEKLCRCCLDYVAAPRKGALVEDISGAPVLKNEAKKVRSR